MKFIDKSIDRVEDELEGAKNYTEKYIEYKARGNAAKANKYKEMAYDELKHAEYIRDFAINDIDDMKKVYSVPIAVDEKWEHAQMRFLEEMAMIRHMLG